MKPTNIGIHFDNLSSHEAGVVDFLTNFDFVVNKGDYQVKFIDLGLSDLMDENGFGSTSRSGTPLYSSPEQLRGNFQTKHSDIWSIGVIFYQLLTGRLPFAGKS